MTKRQQALAQHRLLLDTAESCFRFGLFRATMWYWRPKHNIFTMPITGQLEEAG